MDLPIENEPNNQEKKTLGNTAIVVFPTLGNRKIEGKVDSGATTSSLHAERIQANKNRVSFLCSELSNSVITMEMDGAQEVVSADAGGTTRPIVKFDVEIEGVPIRDVSFNLNDRSEMDSPILIGQNILKAGNFVIDVLKDEEEHSERDVQSDPRLDRDAKVLEAIQVLADQNVTLGEILQYMKTAAVNSIKE